MNRLFNYEHYVKWMNGRKMNRLLCYEHIMFSKKELRINEQTVELLTSYYVKIEDMWTNYSIMNIMLSKKIKYILM
jgi:hypothetical protein